MLINRTAQHKPGRSTDIYLKESCGRNKMSDMDESEGKENASDCRPEMIHSM